MYRHGPRVFFAPSSGFARDLRRCRSVKLALAACGLAALGVGGCAQNPQQLAAASHGKEYFPSSVYGRASERVVADGQPIPHGGGQYLVGKPYTVAGKTYYPSERRVVQVGNASWYGDAFHGRKTANGEIYDRDGFTAAHPTMPLPSYARVTNLRNNYSMIVRVNDRGPYASNRIMDVSRRTAEALDFKRYGTAQLKVEYVGPASLKGSEDAKLYATLRNDGPAHLEGEPIMVAEARPAPVRVASLAPYVPAAEEAEARPARRHREMRQERHEERQEERQEEVAAREPSPEPRRYVARPEAVEAAYRRFGTTHEVARAPMPPRYTQRYAEATDTEVRREPRRRDDRQVAYLSPRDGAPHLPIRDLLPPSRYDGGHYGGHDVDYDAPMHVARYGGRSMVPPARPLDDREIAPRHRVVEARTTRYRDD